MAFEYQLTELGKKLQAQNTPAAKMTSGGNYAFDWNQVGKNPTIAVNNNGNFNANNQEASPTWQQFTAADGTPLIGAHGANGFEVFRAQDLTGGWLGNDHDAKLNGTPRDYYDPATGNFIKSDTISGIKDSGVMGPWGALAVIAMGAGAAAAGLGAATTGGAAGAAGGAGGAVAGGTAGASGAATAAAGGAALPTTFGVVDSAAFAPGVLGGAAGSSGTGLTLGGGGLGLTGSTGSGMTLGGGGGVGLTGTSAGAGSIGGGLGTTGYAAGSGSLLSPGVLAGGGTAALGAGAGGGGLSTAAQAAGAGSSLLPGVSNSQLLGAAGQVAGGYLTANAADKAAEQQQQSVRDSNALLERMFNKQIELQEPFRQNGMAAGNRMMSLLGIGGDKTAPDYGSAAKDFTAQDYLNNQDPGYQFQLDQGMKGVTNAYAGKGSFLSGGALKGIDRYNQDYASTGYQNAYNRFQTNRASKLNPLQSIYGSGQSSANTMTGAAGTYGQNASQNIQAGGNAQAAGTVGTANAWNNTLSGIWNNYQQNELMNQLLRK